MNFDSEIEECWDDVEECAISAIRYVIHSFFSGIKVNPPHHRSPSPELVDEVKSSDVSSPQPQDTPDSLQGAHDMGSEVESDDGQEPPWSTEVESNVQEVPRHRRSRLRQQTSLDDLSEVESDVQELPRHRRSRLREQTSFDASGDDIDGPRTDRHGRRGPEELPQRQNDCDRPKKYRIQINRNRDRDCTETIIQSDHRYTTTRSHKRKYNDENDRQGTRSKISRSTQHRNTERGTRKSMVDYEDGIYFYIRYQESYLCKFGHTCKNDAKACKRIHSKPLKFQELLDELNIIKCSNRIDNGRHLIADMLSAIDHSWMSRPMYTRMKKDILSTCHMC